MKCRPIHHHPKEQSAMFSFYLYIFISLRVLCVYNKKKKKFVRRNVDDEDDDEENGEKKKVSRDIRFYIKITSRISSPFVSFCVAFFFFSSFRRSTQYLVADRGEKRERETPPTRRFWPASSSSLARPGEPHSLPLTVKRSART